MNYFHSKNRKSNFKKIYFKLMNLIFQKILNICLISDDPTMWLQYTKWNAESQVGHFWKCIFLRFGVKGLKWKARELRPRVSKDPRVGHNQGKSRGYMQYLGMIKELDRKLYPHHEFNCYFAEVKLLKEKVT